MSYGAYEYDPTNVREALVEALNNPFEAEGKELLIVAGVGAGLAFAASKYVTKQEATPAVILTGSALYTLGYFIASKRSEAGWGV